MSDKAMGSCEDPNLVDEPLGGLPPDLCCLLSVRKERGDRDNYGGFDILGLVDESGGLNECANSGIERISCLEVDSQVLNCDGDTTNQADNRLPVCSEVASDSSNNNVDAKNSLVFNCDGDMTNQADNHLPLCSEVASDLSNYNVDAKNSLDGFCSSSQDFGLSNCSVDRKNAPDRILSSNQACDLSNFNRDSENPLNGFVDLSQNQGNGLVNSYVGVVSSSVDSEGSGNGCADPVLWLTNQKSQNSCGVGKVYFKESKTGNQLCFLGCEGLLLETEGYQGQDGSGSLALDGEAHLGSSPIVASLSNCIEQSAHEDSENVDSPSEDNSTDIPEGVDEKCEDLAVISNNLNCKPSQKEKVACNLMEGPPNLQSGCAVEESFSFQPSQSLCLVDSGFPKSNIVDGNEKQDIEENDVGFDHVSITECDNVRQSYLRRSSRVSKSSQMIETKSATRQPKKAASRRSVPCRVLEISFKTARGRRSCSHKVARASIWGTFANVLQLFKQNREIQMHDSQLVHVQNVELHEARSGHGRARRKKTLACESSRGSKEKLPDSSRRIRLKVKMGKEEPNTMLSEVIETLALEQSICHECLPELDCGVVLEVPKLANDAKHEICEDVLHDKFDAYVGEKELESVVTEDTSVENAAGDCHWVSSQIGIDALGETVDNKYSELGTSPDSEVINLIHDAPISAGVQDDLQDAVLTSSQVISPSHVTASNMECMTTKREKKKDKFKGRSHSKTRHCNAKETSDTDKLNKAGKSKKHKSRGKLGNIFVSATTRKASNNSSGRGHFLKESELLLGNIGHGVCHETSKLENGTATSTYSKLHAGITSLESWTSEGTMPSTRTKGEKLCRSSKSDGGRSQCRLTIHDSARRHRGNGHGQKKEKAKKSVSKGEVRERDALDQDGKIGENNPETDGSTNLPAPTGKDSAFTQPFELSKTHEIGLLENLGITSGNEIMSENICNLAVVANGFWENLPPRKAWVRCDDCHKWRSISAALADSIEETNRNWFCNENLDKSFADCSIPQEKSNAEINAELNISDASCEEDACDLRSNSKWVERRPVTVPKQASWTLIKSNVFLHRSRKNQTIDEIMVCHCKATVDGSLGCRDECLNRMLNIECVKGTCPCGNLCSNQQFQKRKYAKLKWFRCGKKGYGLQLLEDVSLGEFLIEYVGEVLDFHAYEVRQQEYASRAQKHFYFMTLNGSEVIDACAKGNLGRFINHSCDPNCRTEKWMVNGEVCIGLFAIRDIKKGEEVTFDYNYVRVFGAAAKKCVCGSSQCRGYIGGDPLTSDAIVQGDSDEEYPEPVMVFEDGESCSNKDDMLPTTGCFDDKQEKVADISLRTEHSKNTSLPAIGQVDISVENEDNVGISSSSVPLSEVKSAEVSLKIEDTMMQKSEVSPEQLEKEDNVGKSASSVSSLEASLKTGDKVRTSPSAVEQMEDSREAEGIFSKAPVKLLETSLTGNAMDKLFFDSVGTNRRHKSDMVELKPKMSKARHLMKSSRSSSSLKGRSSVQSKVSEVTPESTNKPRKQLEGAAIGRLEGVEDKLNELLDDDGGISKRKDATKGYLKLLLVTAASRDSCNHKAIQSTRRDLSMILDAILKTKSRGVLVDIISKNGLQMLHNIMKQSRRDHHQIPILRKLLKVLEFLALKDVLTSDHINGGPPCLGMESFRESIFTLTEHDDRQVHQIARKFRDRWIPRKFRRVNFSYRDDAKLELLSGSNCNHFSSSYKHWHDNGVRPTEGTNSVSRGMAASTPVDASTHEASCSLSVGSCPTIGIRTRKRKSRWDQPAETNPDQKPEQLSKQKIDSSLKQELEDTHHQPVICKVVPDQVMDVDKEEANCGGCISNCRLNEAATVDDVRKQSHKDAPPGFSSPVKCSPVPINASAITTTPCILQNASHSGCTCDAVTGHPQGRYLSYLPVSYGIPLSVVQQFGTPKVESTNYWMIAPGVPFHPFPPLPPFPREDRNPPPDADKPMMVRGPKEIQQACHSSASYHTDPSTMSKSGVRPSDVEIKGDNNQHSFERARCSSHGLGRKFRHQKWHYNRDRRPPGVRRRTLGFKGIEYSV